MIEDSVVRHPQAWVYVNNESVHGVLSVRVVETMEQTAGTWQVDLVLSDEDGHGVEYWTEHSHYRFWLYLGEYDTRRLVMVGDADTISVDVAARRVSCSGRDLTASLLENSSKQSFSNWTVRLLVLKVAKVYQLSAQFHKANPQSDDDHPFFSTESNAPSARHNTQLNKRLGSFYDRDAEEAEDFVSHWDMLRFIADRTDSVVYVRGERLFFVERAALLEGNRWPLRWHTAATGQAAPQSNVTALEIKHVLPVAGEVVVQVVSHNPHLPDQPTIATVRGFNPGAYGRFAVEQARAAGRDGSFMVRRFNGPNEDYLPQETYVVPRTINSAELTGQEQVVETFEAQGVTYTAITPASEFKGGLQNTPNWRKPFKRVFRQETVGMPFDIALSTAQTLLDKILAQERVIKFSAPGDPWLTCERPVAVHGVGSQVDGDYLPHEITHDWSAATGYKMQVSARKDGRPVQVQVPGAFEVFGPVASEDFTEGTQSSDDNWNLLSVWDDVTDFFTE